ncbi:MAG: cytosine deaminase [Elusimicrobia bacterium CG06_land_8_20_14_3_00_38_11]|nr:MAG: cytosine deaminase [Elusimicrobia bacterium CG06_land_8_20_14_3_00_38_11]
MDLLIQNAKLRGREGLTEIAITGSKIEKISKKCSGKAKTTIDAQGHLVTESYCNAHLHLCKVWTLQMMDEKALKDYHGSDMGKAMTAIELAARVKENYDEKWIIKNVRKAVELAARYGNLHIRAFVDVDTKARLEGIKAVIKAREEYKKIVDIQVVAFPQDGVVREPGAEKLIIQAMDMGADIVGGIPWIEYTEEDERIHIQKMVAIAKKYNKDVSMLVDDAGDATLKTLEMLATETIKVGWHGRVLAQHARAMCLYPKPYFQKVAALLKKAKMGVVIDPHTGPLHARVRELLEEGVLVCLGQDDISDAYYPYGRNNMLEIAFLASHLLWMTTATEMETLYDMITVNAAKAMNIKNFGLKEGNYANLVILDVNNIVDALRYHEAPRYVISRGKIIAENITTNKIWITP